MVSLRAMHMDMDGSRDGTTSLSPEEIATTVANPFFGRPMQPPTLRVVPTDMAMDMVMAGAMYGLSDRVTLLAMANYIDLEMDHLTFAGGMGTEVLGEFTTKSSGFGDSVLGALVGLDDGFEAGRQLNLLVGVKVPTGSNTQTDTVLTPMGTEPEPRLPYPMQLGTGTWDARVGLTGFGHRGDVGLGGQILGDLPVADNGEGYRPGARVEASAWAAWEARPGVSVSARVRGASQGRIQNRDPAIVAPVQTADPDSQGGDTVEAFLGVNLLGRRGALRGHRLGVEVGLPLLRDLNGPQLETDWAATVGWQKAF